MMTLSREDKELIEAAALIIADALHADSFEIVPEQPYSEADPAYYTDGRCDREQADALGREDELARVLADRQKAEEAARQRMEQLHEKKVAAAKRTAARSAAARKSKATGGKER